MPNWATTYIELRGPKDDLLAWIEKGCAGYEILPGDAEAASKKHVSLIEPGPYGVDHLTFGAFTGVSPTYAHNWYDEGSARWGTKWDLSDEYGVTRDELLTSLGHRDGTSVEAAFSTAWSVPLPALVAMSRAAGPNVVMRVISTEEANQFYYVNIFHNGRSFWSDEEGYGRAESLIPEQPEPPEDTGDDAKDREAYETWYEEVYLAWESTSTDPIWEFAHQKMIEFAGMSPEDIDNEFVAEEVD